MNANSCDSQHLCKEFVQRVRKVVDEAERLHIKTAVVDGDYCEMPGTCGPLVWYILHGTMEAMRDDVCSSCGGHGVAMMKFFHDTVNLHLGKPLHDPKNFREIGEKIMQAVESQRVSLRRPEPCTSSICRGIARAT